MRSLVLSLTLICLASTTSAQPASPAFPNPGESASLQPPESQADLAEVASTIADTHLRLVENRGQWREGVRYALRSGHGMIGLEDDGILVLQTARTEQPRGTREAQCSSDPVSGVLVRLGFVGASPEVRLLAQDRQTGAHNFFLGRDPAQWRSGVPAYGRLRYQGLYEGIDLRIRAGVGAPEYDVLLAPGADLEQFVMQCEGADSLEVDETGTLVIATEIGDLRQAPPLSWRLTTGGAREIVPCRYRLLGPDRYGFEIPRRDPALQYVIDPPLIWSTYLGGSSFEEVYDVDVDAAGRVTVVGQTGSSDFPTTPGGFSTAQSGGFVTQFDPSGSQLVFSTVVGGSGFEEIHGVALDPHSDSVYIAGTTNSPDFPTTSGAFSTVLQGQDAFVARLDSAGSVLGFSTFFGGAGSDWGNDIALSSAPGSPIAITGRTLSNDLPTTSNAFDKTYNDFTGPFRGDAYLTYLDSSGSSLVYSTYLGGDGWDEAFGLVVDDQLIGTVCGGGDSPDFPTTPGAYDRLHNGLQDAFVSRFDPFASGASSLVFSTYIGGSSADGANGLTVDPGGVTTIVGQTGSGDFPVSSGAFDTTRNEGKDAFVAQLDASGSLLNYATYLGSSALDFASDVRVDSLGTAIVTGMTNGGDFPTIPGSFDSTHNGATDAFLIRLAPDGGRLFYGSFLGGWGDERPPALHLDSEGTATIAGALSWSDDFPVTEGAFDTRRSGVFDGFVTRMPIGPVLWFVGAPSAGSPARFELRAASASQVGQSVQVLLSCTGTSGIPLPGGHTLPLTPDVCTLLSLDLGNLLRGQISSAGRALTPQVNFPAAPTGLTLFAAAFTWDPASLQIGSVTSSIQFTTQ